MTKDFNLTDAQVTALTIWGEARDQGLEGMVAVGLVIANRVNDPKMRYGLGWSEVCLKKWQFSCWSQPGKNRDAVQLMAQASEGHRSKDEKYRQAKAIADGLVAVGGAKHYITSELFERNPPPWARNRVPDDALGDHVFFSDVD